ncbi:DUF7317 family protein [Halomarina ordinaria]|uniref:UPF0175 family protein n=1 Tax=Halomarina ordinaria TaxID=3033939 RepID=A0ABD5UBC4_9EURY|nr:UPF0175 family protein [Halomarina sp. PSRA2]
MRTHAVETATALYEAGELTLEQAANYAGVTAGRMAESLRARGVSVTVARDEATTAGRPLAAR